MTTLVALGACLDLGTSDPGAEPPANPASTPDASISDATKVGDGSVVEQDVAVTSESGAGNDAAPNDDAGAWLLYRYAVLSNTWTAPTPLDQYFGTSPNAPPSRNVSSVTEFSGFDRLLVFGDDGMLYVRKAGVWQTPKKASDVFTALGSAVPRSGYHTPQPDGGSSVEGVVLVNNPTAYLFDYTSNDVVTPSGAPITMSNVVNGPPQATGKVDWDFEVYDPSRYGISADWAFITVGYGNDIYRLDGAGAWTHWTATTYPYFAGKSGAPPATQIRGAFYDAPTKVVFMIVAP